MCRGTRRWSFFPPPRQPGGAPSISALDVHPPGDIGRTARLPHRVIHPGDFFQLGGGFHKTEHAVAQLPAYSEVERLSSPPVDHILLCRPRIMQREVGVFASRLGLGSAPRRGGALGYEGPVQYAVHPGRFVRPQAEQRYMVPGRMPPQPVPCLGRVDYRRNSEVRPFLPAPKGRPGVDVSGLSHVVGSGLCTAVAFVFCERFRRGQVGFGLVMPAVTRAVGAGEPFLQEQVGGGQLQLVGAGSFHPVGQHLLPGKHLFEHLPPAVIPVRIGLDRIAGHQAVGGLPHVLAAAGVFHGAELVPEHRQPVVGLEFAAHQIGEPIGGRVFCGCIGEQDKVAPLGIKGPVLRQGQGGEGAGTPAGELDDMGVFRLPGAAVSNFDRGQRHVSVATIAL